MAGPKLTQRKIDKCMDALRAVYECLDNTSQHPTDVQIRKAIGSALSACMVLEIVTGARRVGSFTSEVDLT